MEMSGTSSRDIGGTGPERRTSSGKGSTKRLPKESKPKLTSNPPGARFQCPRCPKNFSRIENLTRHQANHEDMGKFACVICRKRFTRSDLLNRHRRIHGNQPESSKGHVTQQADYSEADPSRHEGFTNLAHRNDRRSVPHAGSSDQSTASPPYPSHMLHPLYSDQIREGYQQLVPHNVLPGYETTMLQPHSAQSQGLTNLMEAALAPHETFYFTPVENINPSLWDGFMLFGDNVNTYMGSYDADISWTLNKIQPDSSLDYSPDYDMLGTEFVDTFQRPIPAYHPPEESRIGGADAEDEDINDWPDKTARPGTPRRAPRIVPLQFLPNSWQLVIDEARISGLSAATIRPNQHVCDRLRQSLISAMNVPPKSEISDAMFPPTEALDYFLRLYIKYLQPRFPILHLATFNLYRAPPLLLIVMMFLGSSHSAADQGRFCHIFHPHCRLACLRMHEADVTFLRSPEHLLTFFLLCLAGTWSGSKQLFAFAEAARGIIVTACRRGRLLDCRPSSAMNVERFQRPGVSHIEATWLAWIETEKRKRLGLSIYLFDSQYPALFNSQPYVSKAETTNCIFPCPEEYWEAITADQWKMLVGPADMPPSTYYLHALNCCLLRQKTNTPSPIPKTNEFGKIVIMYAILTQIFEWRQSTSMLNPTGLMGTFDNTAAHDMGEDLKARRRWLVDSLDSWSECYQTPNTTTAASLLHHLGYISLDVSLSDMHLAAGRSHNKNDGNFAEENLKFWANSQISDSTMRHIFSMLNLCHHVIAMGAQVDASYEVTVCLFTGGIVCWAFAKLRDGFTRERKAQYMEQVSRAAKALMGMGCWRMTSMFGRILMGFEEVKALGVQ